jgi:RecB family endonuclease NucS
MPYVEIKAGQSSICSGLAQKIIDKGGVIGLVAAGTITKPAKKLLDEAGIAWAEQVTEKQLKETEPQEREKHE